MPRAVKSKATAAGAAPPAKKAAGGKQRNKLYAMPEKISEGTVLTDLSKTQWKIGPSIGTGGFGEIYSACRVGEKNYDYVVKCEPHGNGPLFVEMHFYMRNAKLEDVKRFEREHGLKSLGMPHMIGNGSADIKGLKHRFIVMPRYGSDVARHFVANGRRLPEGTNYRLALQMLDVYEFVHDSGYVHADLKAANILLGYGKGGGAQAYLVDYGLASHFTTKEFKPDPKKMHNGTIEYTSRDAHHGVPTMRADLEILGYNLIEWMGCKLPWVSANLLAMPAKVQSAKEEFMADVGTNLKGLFPQGVPAALLEFMSYVAKMKYNEKPDYEKCRKMFANALKTLRIPNTGELEFKLKAAATKSPPTSSKAKGRGKPTPDTSIEEICASDDDDDDVIMVPKVPKKVTSPSKKLKTKPTTKAITAKSSPRKAFIKLTPPPARLAPSPIISSAPEANIKQSPKTSPSATNRRRSPAKRSPAVSPAKRSPAVTPAKRSPAVTPAVATPKASTSRATKNHTPVSAKANININPTISVSRSSTRSGKTIINDSITPNPRAGKTYEFNFELDVSMDANVVVNVKRKKKAPPATSSLANGKSSATSSRNRTETGSDDTPVTRVKVRKLDDDGEMASPRTPAVTVKKSRRIVSPR